jgi:hypothetical protein
MNRSGVLQLWLHSSQRLRWASNTRPSKKSTGHHSYLLGSIIYRSCKFPIWLHLWSILCFASPMCVCVWINPFNFDCIYKFPRSHELIALLAVMGLRTNFGLWRWTSSLSLYLSLPLSGQANRLIGKLHEKEKIQSNWTVTMGLGKVKTTWTMEDHSITFTHHVDGYLTNGSVLGTLTWSLVKLVWDFSNLISNLFQKLNL